MTASRVTSLLAVPGLGLDEASWRPTLHALAAERRAEADVVLLPGFGRRAPRGAELSPTALAGELTGRCDPGPTVLAGHSASCQIVVEAARLRPDLVAGLVLVGPTTDPRARSWPSLVRRWLATAVHEPPGQVPTLLRQYARTGPTGMARAMEAVRHHDVLPALRAAGCPVLVLRGRHDRICPADWADRLARVTGGARSGASTLAAGAHMVPLTHGPLVAAAVAAFLAELG